MVTGSRIAEVSIDWLTMTLVFADDNDYGENHRVIMEEVLDSLGASRTFKQVPPLYNYVLGLENAEGVKVYLSSDRALRPSFMIDLSGRVCQEVNRKLRLRETSLARQVASICDHHSDLRITRIDIAREFYDAEAKKVMPSRLKKYSDNGQIVAKSRKYGFYESGLSSTEGSVNTGSTFYIGRQQSQVFMRVYDKRKERIYSHGDAWLDPNEHHIRWEVVLRKEFATSFVRKFFSFDMSDKDLLTAFNALIVNRFRVVPTKEQKKLKRKKHKSIEIKDLKTGKVMTCEVLNWYARLFGEVAPKVFSPVHKSAGLAKQAQWLEKSVASSLYKTLKAHQQKGGDPVAFLHHLVFQGKVNAIKGSEEEFQAYVAELAEINDTYIVGRHEPKFDKGTFFDLFKDSD